MPKRYLFTDPEVSDAGEDDQNDPEYNFLAEEEAVDEEDFRNDKTVQISSKSRPYSRSVQIPQ